MNESLNLHTLEPGGSAYVTHIDAEPTMRRRLLDIGLIQGTRVTCVAVSPPGDPAAYLIRGAVIALRQSDAQGVHMERPVSAPCLDGQAALA